MTKAVLAVKEFARGKLRRDQIESLKAFRDAFNRLLDPLRRRVNHLIVKAQYKSGLQKHHPMRLHLACGNRKKEGFINIDWRKTEATDRVCDIRHLPYPDGIASAIECYHAIEHFPRKEVLAVLKEWHRVLMPGGILVLEYPDFDKVVSKYLEGDQRQLDGIFGHQRFAGDIHYFGYNQQRMAALLSEAGFTAITPTPPTDYHILSWDCLRIECCKHDGNS